MNVFSVLDLQPLWALETLGIKNSELLLKHDYVFDNFIKTSYINAITNRYVVRFPQKDFKTKLPTNFNMAFARLRSNVNNMSLELKDNIQKQFLEQEKEGIIEIASQLNKRQGACKNRVH